ncbi:MAG: hypothetical protein ABI163_05755 [Thermoanaerobaculia bacterium]
MKKQNARRLVLHKETLRELTDVQAQHAAGRIGPSQLVEDSCRGTCPCNPTQ